jgi:hypothetical protein
MKAECIKEEVIEQASERAVRRWESKEAQVSQQQVRQRLAPRVVHVHPLVSKLADTASCQH